MSFSNKNKLLTGYFISVALSSDGIKGIAGNGSGHGLYLTSDSGANWIQSNIKTNNFNSVALTSNGTRGIAGGASNNGIYYTSNSGATWTQGIITGSFSSVDISSDGTIAIAGSSSNDGIYLTKNSGGTWTQTNVTTGNFDIVTLSLDGIKGISGSLSNIYYSSSPLCYEKNTLILVLENEVELYKKICELKVGDVVKTYKHGYKRIKLINSFIYNPCYIKRTKKLLYKMKDHNVIVTGKHGILFDELTDEEIKNTKKCGTTIRHIDDKKVLPACASDKFEKITENKDFELWHFVLENDDKSKNYGIYINDGILSESCSEKAFLYV